MYFYLLLFSALKLCCAVIYDLTETEYEQMPPLFHIDDYHSCLHKFKSTYCVARFDLIAEPSNNLITLIKEYSEHTTKHYNHSYIDRGVCLETTCKNFINSKEKEKNASKPEDINTILEACINDTIWNKYEIKAKLSQVHYCNEVDEKIEYDWSDWWFGAVVLGLIAINVIGSFFEAIKYKSYLKSDKKLVKHNEDTNVLLCFSIFSNWRYMTSNESKDKRFEPLKGLYGLRAIAALLMPIAHAIWLVACGFTDNPRDFEKASESIHYSVIFNGMTIVQIFFTMSGFLMVYILQVYTENVKSKYLILQILIYRWLRLTPMYALMIFFSATWLRHLGSGPLWNLNVIGVASDCRKYWWTHLFYINNYVPENRLCAIQTWHLAADTQLFILGVIIYVAIKRVGKTIPLLILLVLSMAAPAFHVWYQDLDGQIILKPEFYRNFLNDTFKKLHVLGHNNLSAYVIGMMAGYLTFDWQKNGINVYQNKKWKYLTLCILPAMFALFLSGRIFYADGDRSSTIVRMAYAALNRSVMGGLTVFLIMALVFKVENFQRSVLEWNGWVVPSKLSYGINLFHVNIIHIIQGDRTQLGHVSFFYVFVNYLGILMLSFIVTLPCYLMVEAPFSRLNKIIFQRNEKATVKKMI